MKDLVQLYNGPIEIAGREILDHEIYPDGSISNRDRHGLPLTPLSPFGMKVIGRLDIDGNNVRKIIEDKIVSNTSSGR